jgi:capsular exopolysaccharide synthesis family protein
MQKITLEHTELPYELNEEVKLLRTNLRLCGTEKKVIMLTSTVSGEGKSHVAIDLARSLTELDYRVLVIDADLRKSVLENHVVAGSFKQGLTHYLSGQADAKDVIYSTDTKNLSIIGAGTLAPNPSELLSRPRMAELVEMARQEYDYVVVDCPPLGMVVDAAVIAQLCDGAILVVAAGMAKYHAVQDTKEKLENTKCPILGVVLNKVDRRKNGRYYGYGKYYGYGSYGGYYKKGNDK